MGSCSATHFNSFASCTPPGTSEYGYTGRSAEGCAWERISFISTTRLRVSSACSKLGGADCCARNKEGLRYCNARADAAAAVVARVSTPSQRRMLRLRRWRRLRRRRVLWTFPPTGSLTHYSYLRRQPWAQIGSTPPP